MVSHQPTRVLLVLTSNQFRCKNQSIVLRLISYFYFCFVPRLDQHVRRAGGTRPGTAARAEPSWQGRSRAQAGGVRFGLLRGVVPRPDWRGAPGPLARFPVPGETLMMAPSDDLQDTRRITQHAAVPPAGRAASCHFAGRRRRGLPPCICNLSNRAGPRWL